MKLFTSFLLANSGILVQSESTDGTTRNRFKRNSKRGNVLDCSNDRDFLHPGEARFIQSKDFPMANHEDNFCRWKISTKKGMDLRDNCSILAFRLKVRLQRAPDRLLVVIKCSRTE